MVILHLSGGLGNQMFQYAFGLATAARLGAELAVELSDPTLKIHNGFELERAFDLAVKVASPAELRSVLGSLRFRVVRKVLISCGAGSVVARHYVREPHFHFSPAMLRVPDGVYLSGYWQTEKYFSDAIGLVREKFVFRRPPSGSNDSLATRMAAQNATAISLHIRRGDYVHKPSVSQTHGSCSLAYFDAAVRHVASRVQNPHFYVFSDDMVWVRTNLSLPFPHEFVAHNRGAASHEDMRLMSLCRHHIIANSSFSWWGAWLNPNPDKIVVAPDKWFNNGNIVADLLPKA